MDKSSLYAISIIREHNQDCKRIYMKNSLFSEETGEKRVNVRY